MAADWTTFKTNMKRYMLTYQAKSASDYATKIANEYDSAVMQATLLNGNTLTRGNKKALIEDAFKTAFNLMFQSYTDLGLKPYTTIATAIILYWRGMQINPIPPIPPTVQPSTGFTITFFGLPSPLDEGLRKAFNSGMNITDSNKAIDTVLTNLVTAFSTHMKLISGVYNGLIPSTNGLIAYPPINWTGIF